MVNSYALEGSHKPACKLALLGSSSARQHSDIWLHAALYNK
jgi:hypothetical protein